MRVDNYAEITITALSCTDNIVKLRFKISEEIDNNTVYASNKNFSLYRKGFEGQENCINRMRKLHRN